MNDTTMTPTKKVKVEHQDCPICLEKMTNRHKIHTTECNHTFHTKCFEKIRLASCPYCRNEIEPCVSHKIHMMKDEIKTLQQNFVQIKDEYMESKKDIEKNIQELQQDHLLYINTLNNLKAEMNDAMEYQRHRVDAIKAYKNDPNIYKNMTPKDIKNAKSTIQYQLNDEIRHLKIRRQFYLSNIEGHKMRIANTRSQINFYKNHDMDKLNVMFQRVKTDFKNKIKEIQENMKEIRNHIKE